MPAPNPSPKASMDPNFEKRVEELKEAAKQEAVERKLGKQVKWFRPKGWTGGEFEYEPMSLPFDSNKANQDYKSAVQSPDSPGTSGDIIATQTMAECLAVMERGFRQRHTMRRCRAMAHHLGRRKGQGETQGVFGNNYLDYLRSVMKQSSKK